MILRRTFFISLLVVLGGCSASSRTTTPEASDIRVPQLVGRWIFSPGDSTFPSDPKVETNDAVESPAGATISLGEGGIMTARSGEFIRRGTWKINSGALRMIIDPPPERKELSFVPRVEIDRLTLESAGGIILVYFRDPFVALPSVGAVATPGLTPPPPK